MLSMRFPSFWKAASSPWPSKGEGRVRVQPSRNLRIFSPAAADRRASSPATGGKRAILVLFALIATIPALSAAGKLNYQDDALPVFRNNCLSCHNSDQKKDGLDLSSYASMLAGNSDGPVVTPGDPENSPLYRVITHEDEPTMPPKRDKLAKADLDLIKRWIASGALETPNGTAPPVANPLANLTLSAASSEAVPKIAPMPAKLTLQPAVLARRSGALDCLAASPWAPIVAVGGQGQVMLYDVRNFDLLGIIPFPAGQPQVTTFSRNGQLLLIGGGQAALSGKVSIWNITTGQHITDVGNEYDSVLTADISPDQSTVALGGPSKTLKLYSTHDGSLIKAIAKVHTDWILAVAYSPDGKLLASGDRAGNLHVWDADTGDEVYDLPVQKGAVTALAFRRDSNILASASDDGTIALWDMSSGKSIKSWLAHDKGVTSISFGYDGSLVSCGRDRNLRIWKPDGSLAGQIDQFSDLPLHAVFTTGDKYIVAGDWTGDIRVYRVADDKHEAKRIGSLSDNPPPLSDQIAEAQKRLDAAKQADAKAQADLRAAQTADAALKLAANPPSAPRPPTTNPATKPAQPAPRPKIDPAQLAASFNRVVTAKATGQRAAADVQAALGELSRLQSAPPLPHS
jgi:WD40 repeat protein